MTIARVTLRLRITWMLVFFAFCGCILKTAEEFDKEFFDKQIGGIKAGKTDSIYLYDVHGADALLQSIVGLKGVERVIVEGPNDITDVGLKAFTALPDLKTLSFYEIDVSDRWLQILQTAPKLEELSLTPCHPASFSIATVLALPNLRKLHLDVYHDPSDPGKDDVARCVDATLEGLSEANSLQEIALTGKVFVERKNALVSLQKQLPGCKITLFLAQGKGNPPPIPLTNED